MKREAGCITGFSLTTVVLHCSVQVQQPLTFLHLLDISKHLTNPEKVRRLGAHLGVPDYEIESHLTNDRHDINSAGLQVLYSWRKTVVDDTEAFTLLEAALMRAGLEGVAKHTLNLRT